MKHKQKKLLLYIGAILLGAALCYALYFLVDNVWNGSFVNWFEENGFAAGHFQVWGFRLSDRIVYPFRRLLGYRMGTLFSSIVLMISYLQVVQILKGMQEDFGYKKNIRCRLLSPEAFAVFLILGQDFSVALAGLSIEQADLEFTELCLPLSPKCWD